MSKNARFFFLPRLILVVVCKEENKMRERFDKREECQQLGFMHFLLTIIYHRPPLFVFINFFFLENLSISSSIYRHFGLVTA